MNPGMPPDAGDHGIDSAIRALVAAYPPHRVIERGRGTADVTVQGQRIGSVFRRDGSWSWNWDFPGSPLRRAGIIETAVALPQPTMSLAALEMTVAHVKAMATEILPRDVARGDNDISQAALRQLLTRHGLLAPVLPSSCQQYVSGTGDDGVQPEP